MHGKKKWIVDYKGRIKKSSDRTQKDWLADLKVWEPYEFVGRYRWTRIKKEKNFCPQCKHNSKEIREELRLWNEQYDILSKQYHAECDAFNKKAHENWLRWYRLDYHEKREPPYSYSIRFDQWLKNKNYYLPLRPIYEERSYLCSKCRHKYDTKRNSWKKPYPGKKENTTWRRRHDYQQFRTKTKMILRQMNYDDDVEFPKYKRSWLD